jgi:hypothetical protein
MRSWQIVECLSDSAGYLLHVFTSSLISFQAARILFRQLVEELRVTFFTQLNSATERVQSSHAHRGASGNSFYNGWPELWLSKNARRFLLNQLCSDFV